MKRGVKHPYPWANDGVILTWWMAFGLFSLVLLGMTTVPFEFRLPDLWNARVAGFSLAKEYTLGTWWTAALLLSAGFMCLEVSGRDRSLTLAWWLLAAPLVGLSLDEVGSIHERVGKFGWSAIIPFGVVGLAMVIYAFSRLRRQPEARAPALIILAGFLVLASVGVQEWIEHNTSLRKTHMVLRLGVEEGSELLGCLLIMAGVVLYRTGSMRQRIRAGITDPSAVPAFLPLLFIGLVAHQLLAVFVIPQIGDIPRRGNPGDWYPMAVHLLLAAFCFWNTRVANHRIRDVSLVDRVLWDLTALYFLAISIFSVANLYFMWHPNLDAYFFFDAYLHYYYKLIPLCFIVLVLRLWAPVNFLILAVLAFLPYPAVFGPLVLSGIFAFAAAVIILPGRRFLPEV